MRIPYLFAGFLVLAAGSARAGSVADLGLSLEQVRSLNAQLTAPIVAPGISFGSPTAYGAAWGQVFAGVGGQTLSTPGQDVDGSALVGAGIGDARRSIGFEVAVNVISLRDSFGDAGSSNYKLHRVLPDRSAFAIGVADAGGWGDAQDAPSSKYGVYSKAVDLMPETPKRPLTLAWTVGLGTDRFADPDKDVGVLGSVALSWHRQVSVIADWSGRDLGIATSVVPLYRIPLIVTVGFINLAERFDDAQFAGGVGYLHQF